jgi:UDP-2-acetamido-2-deoxy-ribo-hexuluronate aminotransferase
VYAQYTIQVPNRPQVEERMKASGVPTAVHYPVPLYRQPVFAEFGYQTADFPVSERIAARVISLPMHPYLTEAHQQQVVAAVRSAVLA